MDVLGRSLRIPSNAIVETYGGGAVVNFSIGGHAASVALTEGALSALRSSAATTYNVVRYRVEFPPQIFDVPGRDVESAVAMAQEEYEKFVKSLFTKPASVTQVKSEFTG